MRKINVAVVEDDARLRKTVERVIVNADGCRLAGMFATPPTPSGKSPHWRRT